MKKFILILFSLSAVLPVVSSCIGQKHDVIGEMRSDSVEVSETSSIENLIKWAEDKNGRAMYILGKHYQNGIGVQKSFEKAVEWYEKAVQLGDDMAMTGLALCYQSGAGVDVDYKKAFKLLSDAAGKGNAWAMDFLGSCYYDGMGVARDYKKAFELYTKSAEKGNIAGMDNLAFCYYEGTGVKQDYEKCAQWFKKAAEAGNVMSMYNYGECCRLAVGVKQDYKETIRWWTKSAKKGYDDAICGLRTVYKEGVLGEKADKAKAEALDEALKEAEAGNNSKAAEIASKVLE